MVESAATATAAAPDDDDDDLAAGVSPSSFSCFWTRVKSERRFLRFDLVSSAQVRLLCELNNQ